MNITKTVRTLVTVCLLWMTTSGTGVAVGQTVTGPSEVGNGQVIVFNVDDVAPNSTIQWRLINPFPVPDSFTDIETSRFGTMCLVDPPCGWKGAIRIECQVKDADGREILREWLPVMVNAGGQDDEPDPIDDGNTDDDSFEFPDTFNELGVGKPAFENAPATDLRKMAKVYSDAAEYLYGKDQNGVVIQKGVFFQNERKNKDPYYNVFVWIKENTPPEWAAWAMVMNEPESGVFTQMQEKIGPPIPLTSWYDAFNEVSKALELKAERTGQ